MSIKTISFSFILFLSCLSSCFSQALPAPQWVHDGVVYSLYLRNFTSKGNINSAAQRLEELKKLGVTIIWLLPIHPIGQAMKKGSIGSPYAVQDYYAINPDYGSKDDLKMFVEKAHQLGFKVIIDAIVNHTSWDNKLMEKPEFYKHDEQNRIIPPLPEWKDVAALNYENPQVRVYVMQLLKYWLTEFNLDGFRFDAAGFVPLDFWEQVRKELLEIKPELLLLGEQDSPKAMEKAFNLDYDWKFEETLTDVITNGAPATESIKNVLEAEKAIFPAGALHLRFSDNHDKRRAIARYSEKGALAASVLIFTLDGVPLIYNGMEVGDTTESTDPALFEKMPIFWGTAEMRPEFFSFYQELIALRRNHKALREGELIWIKNSDEARILTFFKKDQKEEFFIAINLSNRPFAGEVEMNNGSKKLTLKPWEYQIKSSQGVPPSIAHTFSRS